MEVQFYILNMEFILPVNNTVNMIEKMLEKIQFRILFLPDNFNYSFHIH